MLTLKSFEIYDRHTLQIACTKLTVLNADKATIHHADFSRHRILGEAGMEDDPEVIIEYLYKWHYEENKWKNGIGYHLVICPDGRTLLTYCGIRGLTGAHVGHHNTGNIGVLVWGDFQEEQPTQAQEETIETLRGQLEHICGIERFYLHKDLNDTTCPGKLFPEHLWKV